VIDEEAMAIESTTSTATLKDGGAGDTLHHHFIASTPTRNGDHAMIW
jgi:hypothetical protein